MKRWLRFAALALAVCGLCGMLISGAPAAAEETVRLVALNIGKADCMLLLWQERAYLIDTGYAQTYPALQNMLQQYHVDHLDGVFLTHCHQDHQGALMALAQSDLPVGAWYAARIYADVKENKHPALLAAAVRKETVSWLDAGDTVDAGNGAMFTVLGPLSVHTENENNNSLVLYFSSPQGSILLTGDMKDDEEYELLDAGVLSACDVLKVGHHGDNQATSREFLQAVQPKAALILTSTQEEPDTPASSTLKRLKAVGCAVYVSQDARDAWQVTLENGVPSVEDIAWDHVPGRVTSLSLRIDPVDDTLTIRNTGREPVQLNGCTLYSSKGNDLLSLPDIALDAGESFVIGSRASTGPTDLKWDMKRVWHQKKLDVAILYDAYGRPVACTSNGLEE